MPFLYLKALHIIFIVTWFAGLFYIVRLFIYMMEAHEKEAEPAKSILLKQYQIMSKRLWYGITWPSAVLTLLMGLSLLFSFGYQNAMPDWLWIKLAFVVGLYVYHFVCHQQFKKLQRGLTIWRSQKLRIWNEVATLFLISIVFLVVLRSTLSMVYGIIGLILFSVLLMVAIRIYKQLRESK
ncbi:CopD family protein [Nafulsella turpanensis]|uniref:CopD family protein n=1 Tax=Nafulsella turpanensis TaxID=1265690 RepID=UPI0003457387|nr:CopD family protein [Nafulsella turpanensis]